MKDRVTLPFVQMKVLIQSLNQYCCIVLRSLVHSNNRVCTGQMPAIQWTSAKAWTTRQLLKECLHNVFTSTAKKYLSDNQLPEWHLFLMDSSPQPPSLGDDRDTGYDFIKDKILPTRHLFWSPWTRK